MRLKRVQLKYQEENVRRNNIVSNWDYSLIKESKIFDDLKAFDFKIDVQMLMFSFYSLWEKVVWIGYPDIHPSQTLPFPI